MSTKTISTDAKHITTSSDLRTVQNGKSTAAPPVVNTDTDVEMDNIAEDKVPLHEDIMQLSRLGEIGPIQKLFSEGKYSPDFRDAEGITPLHVCPRTMGSGNHPLHTNSSPSGRQSIIIMLYADFWLRLVHLSTPMVEKQWPLQQCGRLKDATTILFNCFSNLVRIPFLQMHRVIISFILLRLTGTSSCSSYFYTRTSLSMDQTFKAILA